MTILARPCHSWVIPSVLAGILIFPLLLSPLSCARGEPEKMANPGSTPNPVEVRAAPVEVRQFRHNVEAVGTLFPNEEVTVSAEVEGRVEEVLADVGDRVTRGQPLVKISPVELQFAVDQQLAALRQARARLGVPADGPDLMDVREAAEVKKAAADLEDAAQKYRRAKALMDQGLLPEQNYSEVEARWKSARAALDLALQTVENLRAQVTQYQTGVALARKKLADAVIRAPFDGQVRERTVSPGQYLRVQTPVLVIVSVDPLRVRLKIPEKMAGWVRVGQDLSLTVEAYPERTFNARTSRINPSVDQQTRTFDLEALTPNPDGTLKPGFFVKASLPSNRTEQGLFVPSAALQYVYGIYKVFIVKGGSVREKDVKIGERSGTQVEIVEGLAAGELVAVPMPGEVLKDLAPVRVEP